MGDEPTRFNERELGRISEAIVGLKEGQSRIEGKLDRHIKVFSDFRVKFAKLATVVSLIVSGLFLAAKEVLAHLLK